MQICNLDDVSYAREDDGGEWKEEALGMWSLYE
jgi:hypothetical protein